MCQYQHPGHALQLDVNQEGKLHTSLPSNMLLEFILIVATKRSYPEIYITLIVPAVRNKAVVSKEVSPPYVSAKVPCSHEHLCFLSAVEVHV